MNATKLLGAAVLALGILALAYGGFSYTKQTHAADLGPLHLQVNERERVNVPLWAGIGLAIVGGLILARRG